MDITLAAATNPYPNGWGGPIAIVIPFLLLFLATVGYRRFKELRQEGASPSGDQKSLETAKPQVAADSDSDDSTPTTGGAEVVPIRSAQMHAYIAGRVDKQNSNQLVRDVTRRFKVSESTAWRAIRAARDARKGGVA